MKEQINAEKWYPVEYAGRWEIQNGEMYGDINVLEADHVGNAQAGMNAKHLCDLHNQQSDLLEAIRGLRESLISYDKYLSTKKEIPDFVKNDVKYLLRKVNKYLGLDEIINKAKGVEKSIIVVECVHGREHLIDYHDMSIMCTKCGEVIFQSFDTNELSEKRNELGMINKAEVLSNDNKEEKK